MLRILELVMSNDDGLIVDWHGLKSMGWPYSRTHTARMMESEILRSSGSRRKGTYREWVEPNPDPFPQCVKLGAFGNSHFVWLRRAIIEFFKAHGLDV